MKINKTITICLLFVYFSFYGCENSLDGNGSNNGGSNITDNNGTDDGNNNGTQEDPITGAMAIQTASQLPSCSSSSSGLLYYIINDNIFNYCNGTNYVTIDLTGPSGQDGTDGVNGTNGTNGSNGSNGTLPKVVDGNGVELGQMLVGSYGAYSVLNALGYMYAINNNGTVSQTGLATYFLSTDCSGQPYIGSVYANPVYYAMYSSNWISSGLFNGTEVFYRTVDIDNNGAVDSLSSIVYKSYRLSDVSCTSVPANLTPTNLITLITFTRSQVGIPLTVAGPVHLQ